MMKSNCYRLDPGGQDLSANWIQLLVRNEKLWITFFLNSSVENFDKLLWFDVYWLHQEKRKRHVPFWVEVKGNQALKVEVELINRIHVGGNRVLKAKPIEGVKLITELQIRRKSILPIASPTTTPLWMRENDYKQGF